MNERIEREDGTRPRVLLIDDQPLVLHAIARMLRAFDVTKAAGGQAAWEILQAEADYDCIISDVAMPGLSGPALYAKVSNFRPELAERFVFMSGDPNSALELIRRELSEAPPKSLVLLDKPFSQRDLYDAVRAVLMVTSGVFEASKDSVAVRTKLSVGA